MAYNCVKYPIDECDCCGLCQPPIPKCPICGEECEDFYRNGFETVIGCENCIEKVESYEVEN